MTTCVHAGDDGGETIGERLRLDQVKSIDDSSNPDDAEECVAARRFRGLIQVGIESPVVGALDRNYFASLKEELAVLNAEK